MTSHPSSKPASTPPHPSTEPAYDRGARRDAAVLITGANGEVGHGLIEALYTQGRRNVVAIDIRAVDARLKPMVLESFVGDICDGALLGRLLASFEIAEIYHLAALLSTRGEFNPETAHQVNVGGTLSLLKLAVDQARTHGRPVKFVFPSTIAVYGLPDLSIKASAGKVREDQFLQPITMYGCNKLYCEHLGRYYARHYQQLAKDRMRDAIDFRSVRYPGLISADTLPTGGTSDYAPAMIHAAAKGEPYACFVRPDARIPFLTMPDGIEALLQLAQAPRDALTRHVYNLGGFNPSAEEIAGLVREAFPGAKIRFEPDPQRQAIVDSWPADVDDTAARTDFGFKPRHGLRAAFSEYLVPRIRARYAK